MIVFGHHPDYVLDDTVVHMVDLHPLMNTNVNQSMYLTTHVEEYD